MRLIKIKTIIIIFLIIAISYLIVNCIIEKTKSNNITESLTNLKGPINNILLSYPRSGNHLCRFFIELISETPTFGCLENPLDIEVYKNKFEKSIPFNINENVSKSNSYHKFHWEHEIRKYLPDFTKNVNNKNLILIIRNPKEVLLRENNYKININSFNNYFSNIDYYNNFKGNKMILYYEDMITNKKEFINKLYDFLSITNENKKEYIINNSEELCNLSLNGKNRRWGGNNSDNKLNYYYKRIPDSIKYEFDNYLNNKLKNYTFLRDKYIRKIRSPNHFESKFDTKTQMVFTLK